MSTLQDLPNNLTLEEFKALSYCYATEEAQKGNPTYSWMLTPQNHSHEFADYFDLQWEKLNGGLQLTMTENPTDFTLSWVGVSWSKNHQSYHKETRNPPEDQKEREEWDKETANQEASGRFEVRGSPYKMFLPGFQSGEIHFFIEMTAPRKIEFVDILVEHELII